MTTSLPRIALSFPPDDQAWVRREGIDVPAFWQGHSAAPMRRDVIRLGGRQFVVEARVWEHEDRKSVV